MKKEYKTLMHELKVKRYAETHPNYPPDYIPKTMYKDSTANGLTKAICDYINYHGYQAERINTMGTAREKKTTSAMIVYTLSSFTGCISSSPQSRRIGSTVSMMLLISA